MQACGGNGIIFVDEVQKFVNGSIELFLAGLIVLILVPPKHNLIL